MRAIPSKRVNVTKKFTNYFKSGLVEFSYVPSWLLQKGVLATSKVLLAEKRTTVTNVIELSTNLKEIFSLIVNKQITRVWKNKETRR